MPDKQPDAVRQAKDDPLTSWLFSSVGTREERSWTGRKAPAGVTKRAAAFAMATPARLDVGAKRTTSDDGGRWTATGRQQRNLIGGLRLPALDAPVPEPQTFRTQCLGRLWQANGEVFQNLARLTAMVDGMTASARDSRVVGIVTRRSVMVGRRFARCDRAETNAEYEIGIRCSQCRHEWKHEDKDEQRCDLRPPSREMGSTRITPEIRLTRRCQRVLRA
jgi:hypothetical protein